METATHGSTVRGSTGMLFIAALLAGLGDGRLQAGEAPRVRELRTQRVGDTVYFQVRFESPANMDDSRTVPDGQDPVLFPQVPDWRRLPRLVPQDDATHAVCQRFEMPAMGGPGQQPANLSVPVQGLEFLGKATHEGPAKFLLIHATRQPRAWVELAGTLDFANAQKVAVPPEAKKRQPSKAPSLDDLEGLWAVAQAEQFAVLEALTSEFGFYGFAREATGRKYGVPTPALSGFRPNGHNREMLDRQLFETTTGAAAITESLQRHRMLNPGVRDTSERTLEVAKVAGIDIAEHPWKEMIGDKKPAPEPLARFVPYDNYYFHFKSLGKLLELGDLVDRWGTNLLRAYEFNSRDFRLRERYEKQLCIRSSTLGRLLGPTIIESIAVTGSDLYLREGSDLTILFRVRSPGLFLAAVEPFVQEARKEFAGRLQENKETYQGVTVESLVSPLREVSLHRAVLDDVVVYANSPVALRRVLDARQGRLKALADGLDFQYMRTTFRLDDPDEDGFLFLSDPFIRQLVGPASKIKEKRRLEALTSLAMVTHGVMFTAWENGPKPADRQGLLAPSGLKPDELYAPGGKDVAWDAGQHAAVSDVYNTLAFATPLIELPIDRVTPAEAQGYQRFRAEYLGLWRQYFDPIGMRVALRGAEVRVETYILPLIQSTAYNSLREWAGGGTTTLDPKSFSSKTLVQCKTHINAKVVGARLGPIAGMLSGKATLDFLGDWFMLRLDDSPIYARLAAFELAAEEGGTPKDDPAESMSLFFQIPLTVGVGIRNPLVLAAFLTAVRNSALAALPGTITWEPMEPAYKGISMVRIQANREKMATMLGGGRNPDPKQAFNPAIYYAMIDGGLYASLSEKLLKELIDDSVARRHGKEPAPRGRPVPINSSLYVAPGAAIQAGDFVRMLLEKEVRQRALANGPILYALYRTGLVAAAAPEDQVRAAAMVYLGFVPVSPDGAAYAYDRKGDEIINRRHGTRREPQAHPALEKSSPVAELLEQIQSLRADLRFREDGIHTVLTLERKAPGR